MDRFVKPLISFVLAALILIGLGPAPAAAEGETPPPLALKFSNNPQVAVVEGNPIMLDDLKNAQIQNMMVQLHLMQSILLKQKVVDMVKVEHPEILDIQAKKIMRVD